MIHAVYDVQLALRLLQDSLIVVSSINGAPKTKPQQKKLHDLKEALQKVYFKEPEDLLELVLNTRVLWVRQSSDPTYWLTVRVMAVRSVHEAVVETDEGRLWAVNANELRILR